MRSSLYNLMSLMQMVANRWRQRMNNNDNAIHDAFRQGYLNRTIHGIFTMGYGSLYMVCNYIRFSEHSLILVPNTVFFRYSTLGMARPISNHDYLLTMHDETIKIDEELDNFWGVQVEFGDIPVNFLALAQQRYGKMPINEYEIMDMIIHYDDLDLFRTVILDYYWGLDRKGLDYRHARYFNIAYNKSAFKILQFLVDNNTHHDLLRYCSNYSAEYEHISRQWYTYNNDVRDLLDNISPKITRTCTSAIGFMYRHRYSDAINANSRVREAIEQFKRNVFATDRIFYGAYMCNQIMMNVNPKFRDAITSDKERACNMHYQFEEWLNSR